MPAYLAIFSALARSSRNRSSAAVKSISLRKLRLRRFCIGGTSGVGAGRSVRRVALERAAEAVGTAAAAAELAARHGDDLDADLAQLGVRVGVALVAEDDARLDGEQVVAVSSGHATLAMPILGPLGDFAGVERSLVVTAYQSASGWMNLFIPTSAVVMGGLALAGVGYNRYL